MPNYVPGTGSLQPDLMIIGEAPGSRENSLGVPFIGPSGALLDDALRKANFHRDEAYITNVVKYQPPNNDFKKLHLIRDENGDEISIEKSIESLWENEIKRLNPKCILAVGNEALRATTGLDGILNYRGSILLSRDGHTKVVPTIHPAALFNKPGSSDEDERSTGGLGWTYLKLIESDIARAIEESKSSVYDIPRRQLEVCHSSLSLYKFIQFYDKLEKVNIDIESINCIPVCIGFAFNKSHAMSVPLLNRIGNVKITDMGMLELEEIWKIVYKILSTKKLIGQNLKYDEFKLMLIGMSDRLFRTMNIYSDTLLKTRVIFPELPSKKLGVQASLWTREPFWKDEGKEFKLGKHDIKQLLLYNAKDCAVNYEVDEAQEQDLIDLSSAYNRDMVSYYYNYIMKKHKFYIRLENRGLEVDSDRQKELKKRYTELQINTQNKLNSLVGYEVNVKSAPQVANLLYKEMKLKFMKRDPTSEDTIVRLMNNHIKRADHLEICKTLLHVRRIRDQKSRYINFTPDYDNTCKCSYNIIATETTRSSTSTLKKPVRPKKIGIPAHTISAHGELAKDIKSMFRPRKGKVFVKADASQAEARVVAVLMRAWDLLEAFDTIDIHRRTAGFVLGYVNELNLSKGHIPIIDDLDKEGPERFCGKKTRHAGNYKMGKGTFMLSFNTDAQKFGIPISISEWKAGQMIERFRNVDKRLEKNFWGDIEDAIQSTRCLIDPFGGIRIFNGRMDEETYKEGYANIPQRTVAHLVQGAGVKIEEEIGINDEAYFVVEKHDELVMEVPEKDYELYGKLLKKYMEIPIDFNNCSIKRDFILTIPCDVGVSDTHYGDFRKVKL